MGECLREQTSRSGIKAEMVNVPLVGAASSNLSGW
jgi:hypothetical protein